MNRVATATIIRGNGECQAYINGVVMKEMKRLNERHAAEMRSKQFELDSVRKHRNRLLASKLDGGYDNRSKWQRFKDRVREKVCVAWAVVFAMALEFGFIEKVEEDHEQ